VPNGWGKSPKQACVGGAELYYQQSDALLLLHQQVRRESGVRIKRALKRQPQTKRHDA